MPLPDNLHQWVVRSLAMHFKAAADARNHEFRLAEEAKTMQEGAELRLIGPDEVVQSADCFCIHVTVMLYLTLIHSPSNIYKLENMVSHFKHYFTDICVKKHPEEPDSTYTSLIRPVGTPVRVVRFGQIDEGRHIQAAVIATYSMEI
jgi:hypothetical protein